MLNPFSYFQWMQDLKSAALLAFGILSHLTFQRNSQAAPLIIGIAGGSGSGKTTLAKKLIGYLTGDFERVCHLSQDWYFASWLQPKELWLQEPPELAGRPNVDHPSALDLDLLKTHLKSLKSGKTIQAPIYDFAKRGRSPKTLEIGPCSIVVSDGIHAFHDEEIRENLDLKIFVDLDEQTRLARRILRDEVERFTSKEETLVRHQYMVEPMYEAFVEPSRKYADIIVRGDQTHEMAELLAIKIKDGLLRQASHFQSESRGISPVPATSQLGMEMLRTSL